MERRSQQKKQLQIVIGYRIKKRKNCTGILKKVPRFWRGLFIRAHHE